MDYPTPTPSLTDTDWLRSLIHSGRNKEDVLRLATIKFGHIWGSDVAVLVDAITMDLLKDDTGALDAAQAITNALDSIKDPRQRQDTGT